MYPIFNCEQAEWQRDATVSLAHVQKTTGERNYNIWMSICLSLEWFLSGYYRLQLFQLVGKNKKMPCCEKENIQVKVIQKLGSKCKDLPQMSQIISLIIFTTLLLSGTFSSLPSHQVRTTNFSSAAVIYLIDTVFFFSFAIFNFGASYYTQKIRRKMNSELPELTFVAKALILIFRDFGTALIFLISYLRAQFAIKV